MPVADADGCGGGSSDSGGHGALTRNLVLGLLDRYDGTGDSGGFGDGAEGIAGGNWSDCDGEGSDGENNSYNRVLLLLQVGLSSYDFR